MDIHYSVSATHLKPPVTLRSNPVKPAKAFVGDEGFSGHLYIPLTVFGFVVTALFQNHELNSSFCLLLPML
jgi:hypothetical protein